MTKPASSTAKPPAACQPKKRSTLAPQAKRLLSQFPSDLGDAIQQTAAQAGRLQDYLDAMSEYRGAARLGESGEAAMQAGQQLLKAAPWIGAAYAIARKYMP